MNYLTLNTEQISVDGRPMMDEKEICQDIGKIERKFDEWRHFCRLEVATQLVVHKANILCMLQLLLFNVLSKEQKGFLN